MPKDHLGALTQTPDDATHYGVRGMRWGIRKKSAPSSSAPSHSTSSHGTETSADRYTRLLAQAKDKGGNSLTDEELRFVTQRGDAIAKVNRLNERKPGWAADAAKQVLTQVAKKRLSAVADSISKKYIDDQIFASKSG